MHRRERAAAIAEAAGAEALAVADPSLVTWLTGYASEVETGPSPFQLSAIAVLAPGSAPVLVVSEDEAEPAAANGCTVVSYPGYGLGALDPVAAAGMALGEALGTSSAAIDGGAFPAALARDLDWVDVGHRLTQVRAVKDPDEVALLRAAIGICDAGQAAARAHAAPGTSELELWAAVRGAMEEAAGGRLAVLADLISGERTKEVGGPPGPRLLRDGELVLCDLVPRVAGYWGDSCATFAPGDPGDAAREAHARVRETLASLVAAVRPGVVAGELDAAARRFLDFPHHTGHGIGTVYHEEPRIVPGSETVLEEGMVVALEPGSYDAGIRVEQVVLVTATGCEVLSGHDLSL